MVVTSAASAVPTRTGGEASGLQTRLYTANLAETDHAVCERLLPGLCASGDTSAIYSQLSNLVEVPEQWLCELAAVALSANDSRLLEAVLDRAFTDDCMVAALRRRTMSEAVQLARAVLLRLNACELLDVEPLLAWLAAILDARCADLVMSSDDDVVRLLAEMEQWRARADEGVGLAVRAMNDIDLLKARRNMPPPPPSSGYSVETIVL